MYQNTYSNPHSHIQHTQEHVNVKFKTFQSAQVQSSSPDFNGSYKNNLQLSDVLSA